jgi:hypothetical protein
MVPPLKPQEITYGTAIVDGINVATNAQGFVSEIKDTKQGGFSDAAVATLSNPGTDLLVFIHGFDNTFSDALTRAAFNREWLAASVSVRGLCESFESVTGAGLIRLDRV